MRGPITVSFGLLVLVLLGGCAVKAPECSYLCDQTEGCPFGLACGQDGYCHGDDPLDHCRPGLSIDARDTPRCVLVRPSDQSLHDVFGTGPADVWAVGDSGTADAFCA